MSNVFMIYTNNIDIINIFFRFAKKVLGYAFAEGTKFINESVANIIRKSLVNTFTSYFHIVNR